MLTSIAQISLGIALAYILWKIIKSYVAPSTLDDIPGPPRQSLLLGNLPALFGREGWVFHEKLREYGPVSKLYGILGDKLLFTYDPKTLLYILKDQQAFGEPGWVLAYNMASFGPGLLSVQGEQHKRQRKILNPAFSVAQMRAITHMLYETAHTLQRAIQADIRGQSAEVDVSSWLSRSALDSIGRGGLGYSFDALHADQSNEFASALKDFAPAYTNLSALAPIIQFMGKLRTVDFGSRFMSYLPLRDAKLLNHSVNSMRRYSVNIYNEKKEAMAADDGHANTQQTDMAGPDSDAILSALLKANSEAESEDRLQDDELIAQMSTIVYAATDTTSSMMSRLLHILADHPEVQERLRTELNNARGGQDIPYDQLVQLPYLDAVCKETLRVYPPIPIAFRQAKEDTVVPFSSPIRNNKKQNQHEISITKGTVVVIGIQATNRHRGLWGDDADEWKPDRWLSPLPQAVIDARIPGVYSHLMSFQGGAKSCIGFKFAEIEMKVILSVLLEKFRFSRSNKEIYWNMSFITFPTVGKTDDKSQLPLRVAPLGKGVAEKLYSV